MDIKDKKIIYELGVNARITNKALAKSVYLGESSTINRVNSLVKENILLGTYPIIDNSKIGYQGYRIYFNFSSTTPAEEKDILGWLKSQSIVAVLAKCSGQVDAAILCWVKKISEFERLIDDFKGKYNDKIENIDIAIYLETYHFDRAYLLEKEKDRIVIKTGNSEEGSYDSFDMEILKSIHTDARKSIIEIAEELKKPARTVAFRIDQLERKRIIAGYSINLNTEAIGYEYYKLNIVLNKNIRKERLIEYAKSLKNSIYIDRTIGRLDFELNLEVNGKKELREIVDGIKETFGGIKEVKIFQIEQYLKLRFIP